MKSTFNQFNLLPTTEDFTYNYNLDFLTKFNTTSILTEKKCIKISLNFGFKGIKFEKKQMILHFMLLELLTNQKCVLTTSKKNLIAFKIKKGSITGCKVTLRKEYLDMFLNTLLLALPRSEVFKGFTFKKNSKKYNNFSTKLKNLFIFYTIESEMNSIIKNIDISFSFNTLCDFEKRFFFAYNKMPLTFF